MTVLFRNNAASTLALQAQLVDTTLTVSAGTGNRFPAPGVEEWFFATIQAGVNYEIVKCTARAGDILTVVRAQDGTSARLWSAGASIDMRIPKIALESFLQEANLDDYIREEDLESYVQQADLATYVQNSALLSFGGVAGGSANAITVTTNPPVAAYAAGQEFRFLSAARNTGAVTLNVNGLGARAVTRDDGITPLAAGDIAASRYIAVEYDGVRFRKQADFRVTMGEDWSHNAKYYGVVADDTGIGTPTDNTAALSAYLQILSNTGMPGFWAGRVYCASNIVWDMGPSWERGASLSGVARQGSRLRFGGGIPANTLGLRIHSTTQPFPGFSSYDWLGLRLSQIHILANHDGFALGIGRDDLNGPLNVAVFDQVTVFNTYTGFNSGAWWLKHVVNSYFQMCAGNCYGGVATAKYGTSLRLERVQFTQLAGGSFGNCNIGWEIRDFTNTIIADAIDIEAMRVGIQTESVPVGGIRMRGPRLALADEYCIQLLDGSSSDILSIESYTTDVPLKLVHPDYGRGLLLKDKNGIPQPGFAWDTNITNKTYKVVEVTILGGTPTGIVVNGFDFGAQATTRMLNPWDTIRVNGSGAGAWVWNPMQQ